MNTTATIEIEGGELPVVVDYRYHAGQAAITHLPPDRCQEGEGEYIEIVGIFMLGGRDVTFLMNVGNVAESIEDQILEQLRDE